MLPRRAVPTRSGIVGIGVDVIDLARVESSLDQWPSAYIERLLSPRERDRWQARHPAFVASAIAVKEAAYKSASSAVPRCGWHDIEITSAVEDAAAGDFLVDLLSVVRAACPPAPPSYVALTLTEAPREIVVHAGWVETRGAVIAVAVAWST